MRELTPQLIHSLKHYSRQDLAKDLTAGIIVAIIALPLSIALALASGVGAVHRHCGRLPHLGPGGQQGADRRPHRRFCHHRGGDRGPQRHGGAGRRHHPGGDHPDPHGRAAHGEHDQVHPLHHYHRLHGGHRRHHRHRPAEGLLRPDLHPRPCGDYGEAGGGGALLRHSEYHRGGGGVSGPGGPDPLAQGE